MGRGGVVWEEGDVCVGVSYRSGESVCERRLEDRGGKVSMGEGEGGGRGV